MHKIARVTCPNFLSPLNVVRYFQSSNHCAEISSAGPLEKCGLSNYMFFGRKKNWRPRASMSSNGERKCHAVGASDKQSCVVRSNNYWFSQSTQISMLYSPCSGVSICLLKESWKQNLKLPFCSLKHRRKQVLIVQRVSKVQDSDPPHYKF